MPDTPTYALIIDGRPDPLIVRQQHAPDGAAVVLKSVRGPAGPSAYEEAVFLGYEGTEQEWIDSIRGFYLADGPDDEPPEGTPDRTFVFERA